MTLREAIHQIQQAPRDKWYAVIGEVAKTLGELGILTTEAEAALRDAWGKKNRNAEYNDQQFANIIIAARRPNGHAEAEGAPSQDADTALHNAEPAQPPLAENPRDLGGDYALIPLEDKGRIVAIRHEPRSDAEPSAKQSGKSHRDEETSGSVEALETFSAAEFQGKEPPQRRWLVKDRIPIAVVTLLTGDGGAGKTTIALQLGVSVAARLSGWLNGIVEEFGPVAFSTAEETKDEIHGRLYSIIKHHEIAYPSELHMVFLTLLRRYRAQGRRVSDKPGPTYASALFAKEPEGEELGKKAKDILADAMRRLFTVNKLRIGKDGKGPPSRQRECLMEVEP
jgi:hypothetical protein